MKNVCAKYLHDCLQIGRKRRQKQSIGFVENKISDAGKERSVLARIVFGNRNEKEKCEKKGKERKRKSKGESMANLGEPQRVGRGWQSRNVVSQKVLRLKQSNQSIKRKRKRRREVRKNERSEKEKEK